jgi:hypothetical protein
LQNHFRADADLPSYGHVRAGSGVCRTVRKPPSKLKRSKPAGGGGEGREGNQRPSKSEGNGVNLLAGEGTGYLDMGESVAYRRAGGRARRAGNIRLWAA